MVEYTKRIYYSQLYKMYMFKISCLEIATEQGVNHFPTMMVLYHIGIWNLILATSLVLISAALYCTPSEIQMMNDSTKSYTPKWRRKSVTWWMKNQCTKYGKRIGKSLENIINGFEMIPTSHKLQKERYNRMQNAARKMSRYKPVSTRRALLAMAVIAMSAESKIKMGQTTSNFDTDSKTIGVDNRCSACISCDETDFESDLRPSSRSIKGFGGARHHGTIMVGTLRWKWCDDEGKVHKFTIPNSYYVPDGKTRLLSPQHWAKTQKDNTDWGACQPEPQSEKPSLISV